MRREKMKAVKDVSSGKYAVLEVGPNVKPPVVSIGDEVEYECAGCTEILVRVGAVKIAAPGGGVVVHCPNCRTYSLVPNPRDDA